VFIFQIEPFQRVTADSNKKNSGRHLRLCASCLKSISATFVFSSFGACQGAGPTWRVVNSIAQLSAFAKKKRDFLLGLDSVRDKALVRRHPP
jgi:hypothetical protein